MSRSSRWGHSALRELLADEFPGAWGENPGRQPANALVLRSTNLDDGGHVDLASGAPRVLSGRDLGSKRLIEGDIVLEASGGGPGKPVGRVALFNDPGDGIYACSNFFRTLRPNQLVDPAYLSWYLRWSYRQPLIWRFQQQTTGITNLKHYDYLQQTVPLPQKGEQRRIAEILDTVDEAIRTTESLIAKLELMKRGLVHDLLTLGLGENGGLRDRVRNPGIFHELEGLKVPFGWTTCDLERVVDPRRPIVYGILMPGYGFAGGVPVVKVKDIKEERINEEDLLLTDPRIDKEYRRSRVKEGDLLFSIRGTVGRMAFVPRTLDGANITQDTARIAVTGANARFVAHYLGTPLAVTFIELHTIGQAVKGINLRDVRRIPLLLPSRSEQDALADILDSHDEHVRTERKRCAKLRSLKNGLMDDLLTGRVRVAVDEDAA
jgi:type I restriction enzyme S subunit